MDLRNSNDCELRNFYFTTRIEASFEKIYQKWKNASVELNSGTSKSNK